MSQNEDAELITERRKVYGDPEDTFIRIAQVWTGIIGHTVNPVDVPLMMAGMKLVRTQVCPDYSDNSDDIDGYMDIFRLLVGEDMVEARSVQEYLDIKRGPQSPQQRRTQPQRSRRSPPAGASPQQQRTPPTGSATSASRSPGWPSTRQSLAATSR